MTVARNVQRAAAKVQHIEEVLELPAESVAFQTVLSDVMICQTMPLILHVAC